MTNRSSLAVATLALLFATTACRATTTPAGEGSGSAAGGAEAAARGTAQGGTTAPVANNGVQGNYVGELTRGGVTTSNHPVTVMTDRNGAPQVGFWEFCNVDMVGESPRYTVAPNASCLVDWGDGPKPQNVTAGELNVGDNKIEATITFENGVVWAYTGLR